MKIKERQCHITKQLVHSFSVNIRISQPFKVMFTSASPRWTSLFLGWQILMLTSKECINCIMKTHSWLHPHTHWDSMLYQTKNQSLAIFKVHKSFFIFPNLISYRLFKKVTHTHYIYFPPNCKENFEKGRKACCIF